MVHHPDPVVKPAGRWHRLADRQLPAPPETLRRGPLRRGAFPSRARSARLTSQLGVALAVSFGICMLTGVLSHFIQHPPGWFGWPSRPVGLYRVTQGLHVATGLATVPLLGVKLWSVYPRLFAWPPARTVAHAAERLGVAVLVAAALFQVVSGVFNVARWYTPLPFFFTAGHYRVAWLAIGALLVHLGVKLPIVRAALRRVRTATGPRLRRRVVLGAAATAAGVVTLGTVGQTVTPLAAVSPLAPRRPREGPQGLAVNKTAAGAGVRDAALDPGYRLAVAGPGRTVALSLADLTALPQHTAVLPIACVEGWSATATWTGVRLRDLAALVGADPDDAEAVVESLQTGGRYRTSTVPPPHLRDPWTLIALRLNGAVLHVDHGYPARLIAPNRPGVLQTKWLGRITVRSDREGGS
ncbi:molybdopterin-dependent oxidoreductase [Actinoplanes sp. NPDC051633]|uniref:molybdopterin-dependent oxidoreductase n=1 Tax=Actinoplanes sp. NPDC051633 TaxID=3155670 RepID=UPI0034406AC2